jgi:hypothetical protein
VALEYSTKRSKLPFHIKQALLLLPQNLVDGMVPYDGVICMIPTLSFEHNISHNELSTVYNVPHIHTTRKEQARKLTMLVKFAPYLETSFTARKQHYCIIVEKEEAHLGDGNEHKSNSRLYLIILKLCDMITALH